MSLMSSLGAGAAGLGFGGASAMSFLDFGLGRLNANWQESHSEQNAREVMNFQERMSGSAYQRATKDMAAAGLNPMLAYQQGGASSPGGSQAPAATPERRAGVGENLATAAQLKNMGAQTDLLQAQRDKVIAETPGSQASSEQARSMADKLAIELKALIEEYEMYPKERPEDKGKNIVMPKLWEERLRERMQADVRTERQRGPQAELETAIKTLIRQLSELDLPRAKAFAKLYREGGSDVAAIKEMGTVAGGIYAAGNAAGRGASAVGHLFPSAERARSFFRGSGRGGSRVDPDSYAP